MRDPGKWEESLDSILVKPIYRIGKAGGNNAVNGTALLSLYANYAKDKWTWDNTFDAAYGQTLIGKLDDGAKFQKTDDRLEINSKLGRKTPLLNTFWAAMATFRTQWDVGRDYGVNPSPIISDPFAPAYILIGTGIDYKPSPAFSAYLSPVTAKITIVDNQRLANAGAFGVDPERKHSLRSRWILKSAVQERHHGRT